MKCFLARPTGFEPVTLGLEMQRIGYTNDIVLHRFVILQYLFYNVFTKITQRLARLSYETSRKLVDKAHKNNCNSIKLTKTLDLLARALQDSSL